MTAFAFVLAFVATPLVGAIANLAVMPIGAGLGATAGGALAGLSAALTGSWFALLLFGWLSIGHHGYLPLLPVVIAIVLNDLYRLRTRGPSSFNVACLAGGIIGVALAGYWLVPRGV